MPRVLLLSLLSACLSLCLSACPETPPDTAPTEATAEPSAAQSTLPIQASPFVLLSVSAKSLEPIARYQPESQTFAPALPERGQSLDAPTEADAELLKNLVPQDASYPVYRNGSPQGHFGIERLDPPGCGDYPQMVGQLQPPATVPENETFQAFSYAPASTPLAAFTPPPAPDSETLSEMGNMLKTAFFANQNLSEQADEFILDHVRSFPFQKTAGGEMELGLLISGRRSDETHAAFCGQETFWVLGIWEQGRAVPLASYLHPKSESPEDCQASDLVGSFSTGPALDHVMIQHNGYEWWDYSIYAWREDSWKEVFRGGGGGC
ncbi:MAG: hypothetical protein IGS03_19025 [Candidatus Sericytochromatia bacterium]|nr:hypothetical protein [Candidatus Sericytochromatia bacterium]